MQRVPHGGRRFWIIQLNCIKEELARTDMKEVTEAYSAHTDTHTVYKRKTVYERSIRITTDYCYYYCYYYYYHCYYKWIL